MKKFLKIMGFLFMLSLFVPLCGIFVSCTDKCEVTFYNGDSIVKRITVEKDSKINLDDIELNLEGYEIKSIRLKSETGEEVSGEIKISKDTDFYLVTERLYNVKFIVDGRTINCYGKVGDTITTPEVSVDRSKRVKGWKKEGFSSILVMGDQYVIKSSDFKNWTLTLVPQYEYAIRVSFNSKGGGNFSDRYLFDGDVLLLPIASKAGYVFNGWKDENGNLLTNNDKLTRDTLLTADYTPFLYHLQFGSVTLNVNYGEIFAVPEFSGQEEEGRYFHHWYCSAVNTEYRARVMGACNFVGTNGNTYTFSPVMETENYTLSFVGAGETELENLRVKYGDEIQLPNVQKEGYVFEGWKLEEEILKEDYVVKDLGNNNDVVYLYASWRTEKYNLNFQNGGTLQVTYNTPFTIPKFSGKLNSGYYFVGFENTDLELSYTESQVVSNCPDFGEDGVTITFAAKTEKEMYVLRFVGDGTSGLGNKQVVFGSTVDLPFLTQGKPGYEFIGWQKNGVNIGTSFVVNDLGDNGSIIDLTALWQILTYKVTFDYGSQTPISNASKKTANYAYNAEINDLPEPVYERPYVFVGWYIDSGFKTEVESRYTYSQDMTFYAKIEEETSIFAYGDGTNSSPYLIYNDAQFEKFSSLSLPSAENPFRDKGRYFRLMNDVYWNTSLIDNNSGIEIYLDGNYKTISYTMNVFSYFYGRVYNVVLDPMTMSVYVDGYPYSFIKQNNGTIENASLKKQSYNYVLRSQNTGAAFSFLTYTNKGTISNCNLDADFSVNNISNNEYNFSIFSVRNEGKIDNCSSSGDINCIGKVDLSITAVYNYSNSQTSNIKVSGDISTTKIDTLGSFLTDPSSIFVTSVRIEANITATDKTSTIFGHCNLDKSEFVGIKFSGCEYKNCGITLFAISKYSQETQSNELITDNDAVKQYFESNNFGIKGL